MHEMKFRTNEIFEHQHLGTWNVTSIRKMIRGDRETFAAINVPMDDANTRAMIDHVRRRNEYSEARIEALSDEELTEPLIVLKLSDGKMLLVDGTHRLLRLNRDQAAKVGVFIIDEAAAEPFKSGGKARR